MKFEEWRIVFAAVGLIGILLFVSPSVIMALHMPSGEQFSELWVLGSGQMTEDYPFNVTPSVDYSVYVGVGNHVGSSAYYMVCLKFGNESDVLPNATEDAPSPLPDLYEYRTFLKEDENFTTPLTFSFSAVTISGNSSLVGSLTVNNVTFSVSKEASYDNENKGYFYDLFLELWNYDTTSGSIQFSSRFVGLWLNMTRASVGH